MQFGVDVAVVRDDDLDRLSVDAILQYCSSQHRAPHVLELGSGMGGHTARMLAAGARVTAIDRQPYEQYYTPLRGTYPHSISFVQSTIESFVDNMSEPHHFDMVFCQRTLHYLSADTVFSILQRLHVTHPSQLFISVTGVESAIGAAHGASALPLAERLKHLPPPMQVTFKIHTPLCPFQKNEISQLVQSAGWEVSRVWTSAFGNHKLIAHT